VNIFVEKIKRLCNRYIERTIDDVVLPPTLPRPPSNRFCQCSSIITLSSVTYPEIWRSPYGDEGDLQISGYVTLLELVCEMRCEAFSSFRLSTIKNSSKKTNNRFYDRVQNFFSQKDISNLYWNEFFFLTRQWSVSIIS